MMQRDYRQEGRDAGQRLFECEPDKLTWEQVLAFCEGVKEQAEDCLRDRAAERFVEEEGEEECSACGHLLSLHAPDGCKEGHECACAGPQREGE